jgi:Tfp pilus assembly ATPase PilU
VDQIPLEIRQSAILTGNNLGRLGNVEVLPAQSEIEDFGKNSEIHEMKIRFQYDQDSWHDHLHLRAKEYLEADEVENAWLTLLQCELKA